MKIRYGLLSLVVLWYSLSAGANFYAGWDAVKFANNTYISVGVGLLGVCFQAMIPYFQYIINYNDVNGYKTSVSNRIGFAIASGVAIFSFWIALSAMFNAQVAHKITTTYNVAGTSEEIKATTLKLENSQIIDERTVKELESKLSDLEDKTTLLKNEVALNLKGDSVGDSVWNITEGCTKGVYFTNPKLYKSHCATILENNLKITSLKIDIADAKSRLGKTEHSINYKSGLMEESSDKTKKLGEELAKLFEENGLYGILSSDFKMENCDSSCIMAYKESYSKKVNLAAFVIAILLFLAEYSLITNYIQMLNPIKKDKVEKKNAPTIEQLDVKFFNVSDWMRQLTIDEIKQVVNFQEGEGSHEIEALTLATCHLYEENEIIPIGRTLATIKSKLEDSEYCYSLLKDKCDDKSISNICKNGRLQAKVFPLLNDVFIKRIDKSYYWKSRAEIESFLKLN